MLKQEKISSNIRHPTLEYCMYPNQNRLHCHRTKRNTKRKWCNFITGKNKVLKCFIFTTGGI